WCPASCTPRPSLAFRPAPRPIPEPSSPPPSEPPPELPRTSLDATPDGHPELPDIQPPSHRPRQPPLPSGQFSCLGCEGLGMLQRPLVKCPGRSAGDGFGGRRRVGVARSEEHTSELQSRENLVC